MKNISITQKYENNQKLEKTLKKHKKYQTHAKDIKNMKKYQNMGRGWGGIGREGRLGKTPRYLICLIPLKTVQWPP